MPKSPKKPTKKKPVEEERPVKYNKITMKIFCGDKGLTEVQAKRLLGWQEAGDNQQKLFTDAEGKGIVCHNNTANRPLYMGNVAALKQEILRRRWYLNGENRIIGCTGLVNDGQHTLIAFVLAVQEWRLHPELWKQYWPTEPTLETSIILGVSEEDKVVNTLNTGKPRSLADVIYRSPYFADMNNSTRKVVANVASYCIQLLWKRTGVKETLVVIRTHSESLDFITRHERLLECVKHIYVENGSEKRLGEFISPGYAAGLLYLMASSSTDPVEYRDSDNPNEGMLSWDNWDRACDFWAYLAGGNEQFGAIPKAMGKIMNEVGQRPSLSERCAILVKAWLAYVADETIDAKVLKLRYHTEDGVRSLVDFPSAGGIDLGNPDSSDSPGNDEPTAGDPTPEEIKDRSAEVRDKKPKQKSSEQKPDDPEPTKPPKKKRRRDSSDLLSRMVWVAEDNPENDWRGKVVEILGRNAKVKVGQGFQGAGSTRAVTVDRLSAKQRS